MELIQCPKCKEHFEADHTDLGTYQCPYCTKRASWKKDLEAAFEKLDQSRSRVHRQGQKAQVVYVIDAKELDQDILKRLESKRGDENPKH